MKHIVETYDIGRDFKRLRQFSNKAEATRYADALKEVMLNLPVPPAVLIDVYPSTGVSA